MYFIKKANLDKQALDWKLLMRAEKANKLRYSNSVLRATKARSPAERQFFTNKAIKSIVLENKLNTRIIKKIKLEIKRLNGLKNTRLMMDSFDHAKSTGFTNN